MLWVAIISVMSDYPRHYISFNVLLKECWHFLKVTVMLQSCYLNYVIDQIINNRLLMWQVTKLVTPRHCFSPQGSIKLSFEPAVFLLNADWHVVLRKKNQETFTSNQLTCEQFQILITMEEPFSWQKHRGLCRIRFWGAQEDAEMSYESMILVPLFSKTVLSIRFGDCPADKVFSWFSTPARYFYVLQKSVEMIKVTGKVFLHENSSIQGWFMQLCLDTFIPW